MTPSQKISKNDRFAKIGTLLLREYFLPSPVLESNTINEIAGLQEETNISSPLYSMNDVS